MKFKALESKTLAFAMEADYIEQDVVLTRDSVPIVLHDIYLDEVSCQPYNHLFKPNIISFFKKVTDVAIQFPDRKNQTNGRYYAIEFDLSDIKKLKVTERGNSTSQKYPNRCNSLVFKLMVKKISNLIINLQVPAGQSSFQINTLEEEIQLLNGLSKSMNSIHALDRSGVLMDKNKTMPGFYVEIKRFENVFRRLS